LLLRLLALVFFSGLLAAQILVPTPAEPAVVTPVMLVAAGDISPEPAQPGQDLATATLVEALAPDVLVPLGDTQYEDGALAKYIHPDGYAGSWGRPDLLDITSAIPGNHEHLTADAAGYYAYFGARGGPARKGYYAYDLAGWHVVALNSDCHRTWPLTGTRGSGSPRCLAGWPQLEWLKRDLAAHHPRCILAVWHHPRFGQRVDDAALSGIWNVLNHYHADVVLVGHEHSYSRLGAMTPAGHVASGGAGMRQLTVGTGGAALQAFTKPAREGTRARDDRHHGVLRLELRDGSWSSAWHRTDGVVSDPAAAGCWP
jgi:hypothetical protein